MDLEVEARRWATSVAPQMDSVAFFDQANARMRDMDKVVMTVSSDEPEVSRIAHNVEHSERARAWVLAVEGAMLRLLSSRRLRACVHVPRDDREAHGSGRVYLIDLTLTVFACIECVGKMGAGIREAVACGADEGDLLHEFGADESCDICSAPTERFCPRVGRMGTGRLLSRERLRRLRTVDARGRDLAGGCVSGPLLVGKPLDGAP